MMWISQTISLLDAYKKPIITVLAIFYILIAIVGGFVHFSPVPFWDMWNGYMQFLINLQENHNGHFGWWTQHNEHRIVFSKLLFWIDLHVFNGTIIFLFIVNYLMAAGIFLTFFFIINRAFPEKNMKDLRFIAIVTVAIFSFSWIQEENLTWAFQSQFFAAFLFPLLAFYFMFLSIIKNSQGLFFLSILMGIASVGTMANGILALPLIVFLAMIFKLGWKKIIGLIFLSCISMGFYFFDYLNPPHHISPLIALREQPLQVVQFILAYLGEPSYYIANKSTLIIPFIVGAFIVLSCLFFSYNILRYSRLHSKKDKLLIALLFFMAYIGGTAFVTASGRALWGIEAAFVSRYCTPVLMAWSCMIIIYFIFFKEKFLIVGRKIYFILLIPVLLFPYQFRALHEEDEKYFDRKVAALALELRIPDEQQISFIIPIGLHAIPLIESIEYARKHHWTIFNDFQIKDADQMIGQSYIQKTNEKCQGSVEVIQEIVSESTHVRIVGWIYDSKLSEVPKKLLIVDEGDQKIIGYAITGQPRGDVAEHVDRGAMYAGFKGYMLQAYANKNQKIVLAGIAPECTLFSQVPAVEKPS